jgi:hypothetical protein
MGKVQGGVQKYDFEELAVRLFDELVARPDGMTMPEIMELLEVPRRETASKVITTLRLNLGEGDSIAVPVFIEGNRHVYKLTGIWDEAHKWLSKRARYKAKTIKTDVASLRALVQSTDGRSKDGKVVRSLTTSIQRLDEDLATYLEEVK